MRPPDWQASTFGNLRRLVPPDRKSVMQDDEQVEGTKSVEPAGLEVPHENWHRQRDESERAYAAFCLFRDSEKRQLIDVGPLLNPPCSVQNVSRWAQRHHWQDRCWAFDVRKEEDRQAQDARDRLSMRDRHLKIAMSLQAIAVYGIRELQSKIASGAALNLSPEEIKALMAEAVKMERTTLGTDRARQYTKINVIMGVHRNPGEPCGCRCPACAGCSGPTEEAAMLEAEHDDEPPKLN
jgi:hypothetical protein